MTVFNNVLLIEDNPGDTRLVMAYLQERFGSDCTVRGASTLATGLASLRAAPADIVLLDLGLPDSTGLDTFFAVSAVAPNTPVVILTGDDDEEAALDALRVGAEDYLAKRQADSVTLIRTMRHAVQRRKLSDRLRDSEARYRAIVETAEEGIVQVDAQATIRFANARLAQMLGETSGSPLVLVGSPLLDWVAAEHLPTLVSLLATLPGTRSSAELRLRRGASGSTWAVVAAGSLAAPPGQTPEVVLMLTDISGRKLAEEELMALKADLEARVAERTTQLQALNADLEAFNYTVAHDLRTPLNGILGFAALMRMDTQNALQAPQVQRLQVIEHSAQNMDGLIGSLLGLARLGRQDLQPQPLDVSAMAQAVADHLQVTTPQRAVRWQIAPGLTGTGDPALVTNLLSNLLHNAWKYSARAGLATIQFGALPGQQPSQPVFFVQDNGIGFDMAHAGKLFAPFQRLPSANGFAGNGIGLAAVQRIVDRHGGRIWATSQPGAGATFFFTLGAGPALAGSS